MNTGVVPDANVGLNSGAWFKSSSLKLNGVAPTRIDDFVNERYYSSSGGVSSFPFSSTRTTNAMQFDATGNLVWAPANMAIQTSTFTSANWSKSRVTVPSADTITSDATASNTHYVNQSVTKLTGVVNVTFQVDLKANGLNYAHLRVCEAASFNSQHGSTYVDLATGVLGAQSNAGSYSVVSRSINSVGDGWYRCSITVTTNTATGMGVFLFLSQDGTSTVFSGDSVSGIKARSVRVAYGQILDVDNTGTASYGPRIDYAPNAGAKRGLLIEQTQTNDIPNGQSISSVTAASDTTGSTYIGGWVFRRFTADGTSATHFAAAGSVTPGATQARRVNVIAKAISGTRLQVSTSTSHAAADVYVNINMSTGAVLATGAGASNVGVTDLGNGLYRIGFTYTSIGVPASGAGVILYTITSDSDTRAPVNSSSDIFDVLFFENAASAMGDTSPIPTFGTAVTRGQDTMSLTAGAWLSQATSTVYCSFIPSNSTDIERYLWNISDGTTANAHGSTRETGRTHRPNTVLASATTTGPSTAGTSTNYSASKVAQLLTGTTRKICLNGGTVASSSAAFPTSGLTTLRLGIGLSTTAQINGWVREFRFYADASATDPQLQTLTT